MATMMAEALKCGSITVQYRQLNGMTTCIYEGTSPHERKHSEHAFMSSR